MWAFYKSSLTSTLAGQQSTQIDGWSDFLTELHQTLFGPKTIWFFFFNFSLNNRRNLTTCLSVPERTKSFVDFFSFVLVGSSRPIFLQDGIQNNCRRDLGFLPVSNAERWEIFQELCILVSRKPPYLFVRAMVAYSIEYVLWEVWQGWVTL